MTAHARLNLHMNHPRHRYKESLHSKVFGQTIYIIEERWINSFVAINSYHCSHYQVIGVLHLFDDSQTAVQTAICQNLLVPESKISEDAKVTDRNATTTIVTPKREKVMP